MKIFYRTWMGVYGATYSPWLTLKDKQAIFLGSKNIGCRLNVHIYRKKLCNPRKGQGDHEKTQE